MCLTWHWIVLNLGCWAGYLVVFRFCCWFLTFTTIRTYSYLSIHLCGKSSRALAHNSHSNQITPHIDESYLFDTILCIFIYAQPTTTAYILHLPIDHQIWSPSLCRYDIIAMHWICPKFCVNRPKIHIVSYVHACMRVFIIASCLISKARVFRLNSNSDMLSVHIRE